MYLKLHLLVPAWLFVPFIGVYTLLILEVINIWLLDILQTINIVHLISPHKPDPPTVQSLSFFFFFMQLLIHFSPFDVEVPKTVQGLLHTISSEANSFTVCYHTCDLINS